MRYRRWSGVLALVLMAAMVSLPAVGQEEKKVSPAFRNQDLFSIRQPVVIGFDAEIVLHPTTRLIVETLRQLEFKSRVLARIEGGDSEAGSVFDAQFETASQNEELGMAGMGGMGTGQAVVVEVGQKTAGAFVGGLVVTVPNETSEDKAFEIWNAVRAELEQSLQTSYARLAASRTNPARDRLRALIEETEVQLEDLESRLRTTSLDEATPTEALNESLQAARAERRQLQSDIVTAEAREEAIQKQIAALREKVENDPVRNSLMDELEKVVQIREQELEHAKQLHRSGTISQSEIFNRQAALAAAEIDLLRAKSDEGDESIQQQQLERLNADLQNLAIERDVARRRIYEAEKSIAELTEQLREQVGVKLRVEALQQEMERRRKRLDVLKEQLFELEFKDTMRVPVTVTPWFDEEAETPQ